MDINEIFEEVISKKGGCGHIRATCNCGRTHFVHEQADWDEGEYEELCRLRTEQPDKYILNYEDDYISTKEFNAAEWVLGCPCNWHHKYAAFLWCERDVIVNFLKECRNQKVMEALEIDQLMSDAKFLD